MPTKQVAQDGCTSQDGRDDCCEQDDAEDKDRKKHRASGIIANRHKDEARRDWRDNKESKANTSRRNVQKEERQQWTAFLWGLCGHGLTVSISQSQMERCWAGFRLVHGATLGRAHGRVNFRLKDVHRKPRGRLGVNPMGASGRGGGVVSVLRVS